MANHRPRTPKYCHHRAKNLAYVTLNGVQIYLGRYGSPESDQHYKRMVAEWLANDRQPLPATATATVEDVIAAFLRHALQHYRRADGRPTSSVARHKRVLGDLRAHYGDIRAGEFGPKALRAMRQVWIERGLARTTVNDYVNTVKHVWRWAVSHEMLSAEAAHALEMVAGLSYGRSKAYESEPVQPVPEKHIAAIEPHVSRQVWAIIRLQLLTAARPSELLELRAIDIDTSGDTWIANLRHHKMKHRGRPRSLYFGPRAQAVLKPFLLERPVDAPLFSARQARADAAAAAETHRRANQPPSPRKTERVVRNRYDKDSYRKAIRRACEAAEVPIWTPNQLRHNAATALRKRYGLDVAQVLLGHSRADVTEIYAEVDRTKAMEIAGEIG